jgi:ATP-dependent Lhr-like helicase
MNAFEHLHPVLKHHIINTLDWRQLRPLQELSIQSILSGNHALMIAPTAGGKTEASIFPLISRMLFENWSGLSILYICPIKALLNNLHHRLSQYMRMVGRSSDTWHGDIIASKKNHMISDPPDCLLTTPESIESILISKRIDHKHLLENLHAVVIDEIHAFAGDDRGWHLLSLLERLTKITGREIQRLGLSATVGNPKQLLNWLSGHCKGESQLFIEQLDEKQQIDVKLDYVGNLENAAIVLSRLHKEKKRLVFCDSRARVERLASLLHDKGVKTFVTHSSLSKDIRHQSEDAFRDEKDCVIVATSVLELGIDVGDLDVVIQIDAPSTVSSFLQRLGRTGRRKGSRRNCLFLATSDNAFLQSAAILELWSSGFVEPVIPPPCPYHVYAQQLIGIILQEKGSGLNVWKEWLERLPPFKSQWDKTISHIFKYMIQTNIFSHDQGLVWLGDNGEKQFGFRNFMTICSVFTSSPLITVKHMKSIIGYVDAIMFSDLNQHNETHLILLGGQSWLVTGIDWNKRIAYVKPTKLRGKSNWLGTGNLLSYELCMGIKKILATKEESDMWSKRAIEKMKELRDQYFWIDIDTSSIHKQNDDFLWWTFAGKKVNLILSTLITKVTGMKASCDNFKIRTNKTIRSNDKKNMMKGYSSDIVSYAFKESQSLYKFKECLPQTVISDLLYNRHECFDIVKALLK